MPRRFVSMGLLLAVAFVSGCGSSSSTSSQPSRSVSTIASELAARRDAFVAFYENLSAKAPARKASLEAALRINSALSGTHANAVVAARALSEYFSDATAWQRAMRSLPAGNGELASIRSKFARGAVDEVRYARNLAAVILAASARQPVKALAERAETEKAASQKANAEAGDEMTAVEQRLGGASAFKGRINPKSLEELVATMKQEAGPS
jgi:hypothetical protein